MLQKKKLPIVRAKKNLRRDVGVRGFEQLPIVVIV